MVTQKYLDELTYEVVGASIEVHKIMGRGLLESVYHKCLKEELGHRKINFLTEMSVPVIYKGKELDMDFRCDLFVEECLVVELKSVSVLSNVHEAGQMCSTHLSQYVCGNLYETPKITQRNFNKL